MLSGLLASKTRGFYCAVVANKVVVEVVESQETLKLHAGFWG